MEKTDGETLRGFREYAELAENYSKGKIEIDKLIGSCTTKYSTRIVARVLTKCILKTRNQEWVENAKEALKKLAEKDIGAVVEGIVRQIIFCINNAEKKGRKWNEENLNFLFEILDKEILNKVTKYATVYINKFYVENSFEQNPEGKKEYEVFLTKASMPGSSRICEYILERAKRKEEIEFLEWLAGPLEYYRKNKELQNSFLNTRINKNVLCGYLSSLTTIALIKRDIELIAAYAHFYEMVYFVLRYSELSVLNKNMEKENFFEILDKLMENGSKKRVIEVLFEGIGKLKEEGKKLTEEALKRLFNKHAKTFVIYYEYLSNKNKLYIKELVEDFIMKYGKDDVKKSVFEINIRGQNDSRQTFINSSKVKGKT